MYTGILTFAGVLVTAGVKSVVFNGGSEPRTGDTGATL
jgi:hypothetical protein